MEPVRRGLKLRRVAIKSTITYNELKRLICCQLATLKYQYQI